MAPTTKSSVATTAPHEGANGARRARAGQRLDTALPGRSAPCGCRAPVTREIHPQAHRRWRQLRSRHRRVRRRARQRGCPRPLTPTAPRQGAARSGSRCPSRARPGRSRPRPPAPSQPSASPRCSSTTAHTARFARHGRMPTDTSPSPPLPPATIFCSRKGSRCFTALILAKERIPCLPVPPSAAVTRPGKVFLQEGVQPEPVIMREIPTVRVEVQFLDSQGLPARGNAVVLFGNIPNDQGAIGTPRLAGPPVSFPNNDPEPAEIGDYFLWSAKNLPDENGHVVFRVPRGLLNARLFLEPPDSFTSYKFQLFKDAPLQVPRNAVPLGTLNVDNTDIAIRTYKSPVVVATVRTSG